MNGKKKIVFFLFQLMLLLVSIIACDQSPERARKKLNEMGISYSIESFINSVLQCDKYTVQLFLNAGMDPNVRSNNGKSASVLAAEKNHIDILKLLIKAGASDLENALVMAIKNKNHDIVSLLLGYKINVNSRFKDGLTPLMFGAMIGDVKITSDLLKAGANVDESAEDGTVAIMLAIIGENALETFKLLISAGADLKAKSNGDVLSVANSKNRMVNYSKGGSDNKYSIFQIAIMEGEFEIVKMLIENEISIDKNEYQKCIIIAILEGYSEIFKLLMNTKIEYGKEDLKDFLFMAITTGHLEIVRDLLNAGADANSKDDDGTSFLMHSVHLKRFEISKLLLEFGADVNARSNDGFTPLIYAVGMGDKKNVKMLLEFGANIYARDKNGYSAVTYAKSMGFFEIVDLLQNSINVR